MKKRLLSVLLVLVVALSMFSGCGNSSKGEVYYLNFKPEQDSQWQELAEIYEKETGTKVTVLTAASGQYETTLKSEISKTKAPTLFQVNGPVGLSNWKDYCYDLTGTDIINDLSSSSFALMDGKTTAGVAYVVESYGIIYNKALLAKAGYSEADIKNFDGLKKVAEDITKRSAELGFSAFTSAGMDGSSDWRFKTHLANLPIYYEYMADGISATEAIKGSYLDEYRQIWDLYINNATCSPSVLSSKTGGDAVAEFVSNKAVFYQNGTWAYGDVSSIGDDNLGMLPIYIGVAGEENNGLCTGTENYWCVNKNASEADIKATLDFMHWVVTSETGVKAMCGTTNAMPSGEDGMGFVIPFKSNMASSNKLVNIANDYVNNGYTPISWNFTTMPSENWKNVLGSALTTYAANQTDANWQKVEDAFVNGWVTEIEASK